MNQLNQNKMKDNKLIAEFMGSNLNGLESWQYEEELQYHTSWDWLMPVAEKCLTTDEPSDGRHYVINDALLTCNIDEVYKEVVEFIKEHNDGQ